MLAHIRRLIALLFLAIFIYSFLAWGTSHESALIARSQFTPALLSSLRGESWAIIALASLLLLTLLLGRVYCSWICPLGIMQDIARHLRKGKAERYSPNPIWIRAFFGGSCLIALLSGSILILSLLDPYSIAARFCSAILNPLAAELNNALGRSFIQPDWARYSLPLLLLVALSLLLPLGMAIWRGRIYCNSICPLGALLGLLSRFAPLAPHLTPANCGRCAHCVQSCKSQAIDLKTMRIDKTRCVGCYNCIASCSNSAISIRPHNPFASIDPSERPAKMGRKDQAAKPRPTPSADPARRAALGLGACAIGSLALPSCRPASAEQEKLSDTIDSLSNNHCHAVIPPGAGSLANFLQSCTGCGLCITACPTKTLKPSLMQHGLSGLLKPHLNFRESFCAFDCNQCGNICPEGAIAHLPLKLKQQTQIGLAEFHSERCLIWADGVECGACIEHCPTKALYIRKVSRPKLIAKNCTGCGLCAKRCYAQAISIHNGLPVIDWAKCTGCGHCIRVCPHQALDYDRLHAPILNKKLCIGCGGCEAICPATPKRALIITARAQHLQTEIKKESP